jgi:hypothetical protein
MVGGRNANNPFYGTFCCQICRRKFGRREIHILEEAEALDPDPNGKRMESVKHLNEQERTRKEHLRLDRGKRIERDGLPAVRKLELTYGRARDSRRTEILKNDPAARAQASKYSRKLEQNRLQKGGKPEESGTGKHRKLMGKKERYPNFFMDKLTLAARYWAREYGQPSVYWNDILELFDLMLIEEQTVLGVTFNNGKPKYLHFAYCAAVSPVLVKCENLQKKWEYLQFEDGQATITPTSEQKNALFPAVFKLVYGYYPGERKSVS